MATGNNILQKLEDAFAAYLQGEGLTITDDGASVSFGASNVFAGYSRGLADQANPQDDVENITAPLPRITCISSEANPDYDEAVSFQGNWVALITIQLVSDSATTSEADHQAAWASILDEVLETALATELSNHGEDFTAHFWRARGQSFDRDEQGEYVSNQTVEVWCMGS